MNVHSTSFQTAFEDLLNHPKLSEFERNNLRDKYADGKISGRDLFSRYMAIGEGVPKIVFELVEAGH